MKSEEFSISELYHENSKYFPSLLEPPSAIEPQDEEKTWLRAPKISLPEEFTVGETTVEEAIVKRRSIRHFTSQPISLGELAKLLFFSCGTTGKYKEGGFEFSLRAHPSAGALYPLEVYLFVLNADGIQKGIYKYKVLDHALEFLRPGDHREELYSACLRQEFVRTSSCLLFIAAIFGKLKVKYGERGYRFCLLEAGHLAQNIYLMATSMGLGTVAIGGFLDDELNDLLRLDGVQEATIYGVAVGRPKMQQGAS